MYIFGKIAYKHSGFSYLKHAILLQKHQMKSPECVADSCSWSIQNKMNTQRVQCMVTKAPQYFCEP